MKSLMKISILCLASLGVAACDGGGHHDGQPVREVGASVITLKLPERFGSMQRPPVELNHEKHTTALDNVCTKCHLEDDNDHLSPKMGRETDGDDRDALVKLYHDRCIGCHVKRKSEGTSTGPQTCNGCHAKKGKASSAWTALRMDASLHARHVTATNESCESCHHVYDEAQKKLVYKAGAEGACGYCHGKQDKGDTPSLRNASHESCISCHIKNQKAKGGAGPLTCVGCHDKKGQAAIKRLKNPERLVAGQRDQVWIKTAGAKAAAVGFDHAAHEKVTPFCTTCHHSAVDGCGSCHAPEGTRATKGGEVSLDNAHHAVASKHSCVGCHKKATETKACAGCHHTLGKPPRPASCITCHNGRDRDAVDGGAAPLPQLPVMQPVPALADEFPDKVTIDVLANKYEPTVMPHKQHAEKLLSLTKDNTLASRFHGSTATLCAGCHHHTPAGTTPPPCRGCHHGEAAHKVDRPSLKSAFHRQCMGCHSRMGIDKRGCTDCHAKARAAGKATKEKE